MSIKIKLPQTIIKRCRDFAEECVHTNIEKYKKRNQSNIANITDQIFTGKLGEFGVQLWLGTEEPDLAIYEKRKKSFAPDLFWDGQSVHVKGQTRTSADKYGVSWSFQIEDKLVKSPTPEDIGAFCVVEEEIVEIYTLVQMSEVTPLLREPIVHQLRHIKRVLYWEDVKKAGVQPIKKMGEDIIDVEVIYDTSDGVVEEVS